MAGVNNSDEGPSAIVEETDKSQVSNETKLPGKTEDLDKLHEPLERQPEHVYPLENIDPHDLERFQDSYISDEKRVRTLTEKGLQYQIESKTVGFKSAVKTHRTTITKCRNYLENCVVDIQSLTKFLCTLEHAIDDVADSYYRMGEIDQSLCTQFEEDFKDCKQTNLALRGELSQALRKEEVDAASHRSRSNRSDHSNHSSRSKQSRTSHHSRSETSHHSRSETSHHNRSDASYRSRSSIASMKAEAAAKAAALKAKLQYLEEESQHKIELEEVNYKIKKLATLRDIAVEEAKLQAIDNVESKNSEDISKTVETHQVSQQSKSDIDTTIQTNFTAADKLNVNGFLSSNSVTKNYANIRVSHKCKSDSRKVGFDKQVTQVDNESVDARMSDLNQNAPIFIPASNSPNNNANYSVNSADQLGNANVFKSITDSLNASRLPAPEPDTFTGDPIDYPSWKCEFSALIESRNSNPSDKIFYLKRCLSGNALKCVKSYLQTPTPDSFDEAMSLLETRFGDMFSVAQAFKNKIELWPNISSRDSSGLREFSDFLKQCSVAARSNPNLRILDDENQNRTMLSKLPEWLIARWSREAYKFRSETQMYPPFSQFVTFLCKEADIACDPVTSHLRQSIGNSGNDRSAKAHGDKPVGTCNAVQSLYCIYCNMQNHSLETCLKLQSKTRDEKSKFIQEKGLCFGCLQSGHIVKSCRSRLKCAKCNKQHPTVLHNENAAASQLSGTAKDQPEATHSAEKKNENQVRDSVKPNVSLCTNEHEICNRSTMIVPVYVSSQDNLKRVLTYALLDTQSDTSFISNDLCDKLQVNGINTQLMLSTMTSENNVMHCRRIDHLSVQAFDGNVRIPLPSLFTHSGIPGNEGCIPTASVAERWPYLKPIVNQLMPKSDCGVGLLIGSNCPRALTPREVIPPADGGPFAQRTELGWGVVGPIGEPCKSDRCHSFTTNGHIVLQTTAKELFSPKDIVDFFRREESGESHRKGLSSEDLQFLDRMKDGIRKCEDNHYEMPLPLKDEGRHLIDNKPVALERLKSLVRKFQKDPNYYEQYIKFMNNLIDSGYAEIVPREELGNQTPAYYLPHHGVKHPAKPGKIRIVMDASAKFKGQSLNSNLLQGPDMLNSLIGVLCKFRQESVAFTCDVKEMFYQFRIPCDQRNFLRFLWFADGNYNSHPIVLRSRVHIFGATSSPAVAQYGLKRAACDGMSKHGEDVCKFINHNFYVDDGLKSVSSIDEALELIDKGIKICHDAGMQLHKFTSNRREVLESLPHEVRADSVRDIDLSKDPLPIERTLGVKWCIESDAFKFRIVVDGSKTTRRGVLQTVCSMYDPLGFISPVILFAKMILQDMCRDGLGWDDPIPDQLLAKWIKWLSELPDLEQTEITRCFRPSEFGEIKRAELHNFSDASSTGYGQCSFLKLVNENDDIHCSLVMAKSRVAPLKATTIPRLELIAAVLSTEVAQVLNEELEFENLQNFYWTDSKVVLGFLANDVKRFCVFVANRLQKIKDIASADKWFHIGTKDNPADIASRGCTGKQLLQSRWFAGPQFLWTQLVPQNYETFDIDATNPEVRKATCHATTVVEIEKFAWPVDKFNWSKTKRVIAICIRFIANLKNKSHQFISVSDLVQAERLLVKQVQSEAFAEDMQQLRAHNVTNNSCLKKLDPFLDAEGLVRVGGRLEQGDFPYEIKHPVVIPKSHTITGLIVNHFHEKAGHQGKGMTINEVRNNGFWVLGLSSLVSSMIFKCVTCRKQRSQLHGQKMANLPPDRLDDSPAFTHVAIDCFGPFYIQEKRREIKRYGLLFTCMASRAVHLETLTSMTTDSFINALRRFIAIRGPIRTLRSDRGTNFIGGMRELKESLNRIDDQKVKEFLLQNSCDHILNVPGASHHGGVWERMIRSVRSVMTSLLSKEGHLVDDESLRTLMHEAANIVNSRPLTVTTLNDPTSSLPLCPNHLLTMKSGVVISPPGEFSSTDGYSRKRWRRVQYLANLFWDKWKKEYVLQMQERQKWLKQRRNLQKGDIVLVLDDNLPRSQWKVARVAETYPSVDGLVRKVKVQLGDPGLSESGKRTKAFSYLERPVQKLVLLLEVDQK